jgi:preprotein translocase subunit SecA
MSAAQIAALQAAAARAAALRSPPVAAAASPRAEESGPGEGPASSVEASRAPDPIRRDKPKVGRNDPCWCGSGKKYKNCHMREDQAGGGAIS